MATRVLADLPEIPPDGPASRFGGLQPAVERASGFFRTVKRDGRWWLVDPEDCLFVHRGVASVREIPTAGARDSLVRRYGTSGEWAAATGKLLKGHAFNGTGAWSDDESLHAGGGGLVYTRLWNFMSP